ncbi:hypothetical protein C9J12_29550 [Photobacterium frigidiphilum]|uniref:Uncharacterized protein n=1 Tax=Photobacterium frigidiphilum TaxID=264736 RepID=A0A2T3J5R6_9GAMM|nr:hypothetical protein C9J12_29550 [Photobacterium frigidiphilum]
MPHNSPKNITSNISCTTANSPSTLNSIPKLRSKTCQLDVFVIPISDIRYCNLTLPMSFTCPARYLG